VGNHGKERGGSGSDIVSLLSPPSVFLWGMTT